MSKAKKVFVSYSHKDEDWKDLIVEHFTVTDEFEVWDDREIELGSDWFASIKESLHEADIALLLISKNFLNSDFILNEEIYKLLERAKKENLKIVPIQLTPCAWETVDWLHPLQGYPKDNKPLSSFIEKYVNDFKESHQVNEEIKKLVITLSKNNSIKKPSKKISKSPSSQNSNQNLKIFSFLKKIIIFILLSTLVALAIFYILSQKKEVESSTIKEKPKKVIKVEKIEKPEKIEKVKEIEKPKKQVSEEKSTYGVQSNVSKFEIGDSGKRIYYPLVGITVYLEKNITVPLLTGITVKPVK